ncbi:MAG: hypothetical protein IKE01_04825 [Clostridia bacterium]|nr:hypothetical protein [Clostridia bacterium]
MDMDFYEKLIAYYKCRIEDDEKYNKRIENEEKDAYRVMKALNESKHPITIKNIGDLARLLNVAKQLTTTDGRNIFEEFGSIPQVESIINNMTSRKPEQIQAIQDYDFSDWEPMDTLLEQDHKLIVEFKKINTSEIYMETLSKIKGILTAGNPIQIKSEARAEEELTAKHKAILSMPRMFMRENGLVPNSELKFEDGKVVLEYLDAEKVFGSDIIKAQEQTMGITPAQADDKKKQEDMQNAALDRWKRRTEDVARRKQQTVADKWETNPNVKRENIQRKQKHGNDRGMSR